MPFARRIVPNSVVSARMRDGSADYTGKLCVIGTNLKEEELEKAFSCLVMVMAAAAFTFFMVVMMVLMLMMMTAAAFALFMLMVMVFMLMMMLHFMQQFFFKACLFLHS